MIQVESPFCPEVCFISTSFVWRMKEALVGTLDLNAKLISMEFLIWSSMKFLLWISGYYFCQTIGGVFQNNADIVLLVIPFLWKELEV